MSQEVVKPMIGTNVDALAETKQVYWRPVTTGTALKVGDSVCYCKDAQDYKERGTTPITGGTAYAEGSQNYTGRLFIVEEPLVDNLDQYAGVVARLGPLAGADGDLIDIYIPNGAVVPARIAALTTVAGRSILAVKAGSRTLDVPYSDTDDYGYDTAGTYPSRSVGIAQEVRTTTGLCWVKLDDRIFINQSGQDGTNMLQVPASANSVAVNKSFIDFKNTDGHCTSWLLRTRLSGTGSGAQRGVYRFDVMMDATTYGEYVYGMTINVDVACTASQTTPGHLYGLSVMLRTQSDPDMSGTVVANVYLESYLRKNAAADDLTNEPNTHTWFRFNANGSMPDYLFYCQGLGTLGDSLSTSEPSWGGDNRKIPILFGGSTYYIRATVD